MDEAKGAITMHILHIQIVDLPPLEYVRFNCDERVNLFIGPNATGKSTILRAINSLDSVDKDSLPEDVGFEFYHSNDQARSFFVEATPDWLWDTSRPTQAPWDEVPLLYIPATRVNLPGVDIYDKTIDRMENDEANAPLKDLFDTDSGIFDGQYVELAIERLREIMTGNRSQETQLRKAVQVGYSCAQSICLEVIHDDMPHTYVELRDEDDDEEGFHVTERIVHYDMGIGTTDDILGEPLYAGALSSGTQGTLLWVWALALKMVNNYGWTEGWEKKPAILLIDEIENHLHPTWQRRVIPALLEHFPGLQIFATTHSPFVVAGLKAGQVHLLKRNEDGRVTATTNTKDVVGWTSDEILRTMMGVDDPTDDATAAAARELRQLRKEGPRIAPEEEERRQERIQELRQLVDRDLLAGGPMAARRELFEQQFAEALEKYRQSKNLNQENG